MWWSRAAQGRRFQNALLKVQQCAVAMAAAVRDRGEGAEVQCAKHEAHKT